MVVGHIPQAAVRRGTTRAEEAAPQRIGVEDARVAQTRLGADERVEEEPGRVGEVGAHERVCGAEEIEEDEVLDRREGCCGRCGGEEAALWVWREEGCPPCFGEVSEGGWSMQNA